MSNRSDNAAAIDAYREELRSMLNDISQIDAKVLTGAVNQGLTDVKKNTNVITGTMRKGWHSSAAVKVSGGVQKSLDNNVEYASYANDGHRVVNKKHETVGYVEGQHMLEKAGNVVEKSMIRLFNAEVERVNREHDK
jgi:hypothetical protein